MSTRFEQCLIGFTWRPENDGQPCHYDPRDSGGTTSWGMTYATYSGWLKNKKLPVPPLFTFSTLARTAFIPCYQDLFWNTMHCDDLPIGLDLMVFDFSVLSGEVAAINALQECLHIKVTGKLTPDVLEVVKRSADTITFADYLAAEKAHFQTRKNFAIYGHGWERRAADAAAQAFKDQTAAQATSV